MKYIRKINESKDVSEYYQVLIDEFSDYYTFDISTNKRTIIINTKISDLIIDDFVKTGKNVDVAIDSIKTLNKKISKYEELLQQIKHIEDNLKIDNVYYDITIRDFIIEIYLTDQKKIA